MHSFNSCLVHCVWSTKNREPILTSDLRERLWPYLGGIAKENKIKALAISGATDHVHVLLSLPPTLSVAKAIQLLKGNSSKWIHETFSKMRSFEWQQGYAHSVSVFRQWIPQSRTSAAKPTTIARDLFAKNSK